MRRLASLIACVTCGCGSSSADPAAGQDVPIPIVVGDAGTKSYGGVHSGNFWLGPVDFAETQYHNACSPYPALVQKVYGNYLVGLANEMVVAGQTCDRCVEVTANGKSQIAHVVTYGLETGPDDIDVSPELDAALDGNAGRKGTWQFTTCPTTAPVYYNFDGRDWSNPWYFRVWVRNARQPATKVESKVGSGGWTAAATQTDGAWQANGADFSKGFSLRIGSLDGQSIEDTLPGIGTFDASTAIASHTNFQ